MYLAFGILLSCSGVTHLYHINTTEPESFAAGVLLNLRHANTMDAEAV